MLFSTVCWKKFPCIMKYQCLPEDITLKKSSAINIGIGLPIYGGERIIVSE